MQKGRIGEMLVRCGIITEEQLNQALSRQPMTSKKLGEILIDLGFIKTKDLVWMLSEQASLEFVDIRREMLDAELVNRFPRKTLYDNVVLPLYETGGEIFVAVGNPADTTVNDRIRAITGKNVRVAGADPKKIVETLDQFYRAQETGLACCRQINVSVTGGSAEIEFVDAAGATVKKRLPIEISIRIKNPPVEEEDARN